MQVLAQFNTKKLFSTNFLLHLFLIFFFVVIIVICYWTELGFCLPKLCFYFDRRNLFDPYFCYKFQDFEWAPSQHLNSPLFWRAFL